jgi:hypothetical protein
MNTQLYRVTPLPVPPSQPTGPRRYCQFGILLTLGVWIAANFFPCTQVVEASRYARRSVEVMHGFRLMVLGWLRLLALSFAWYANIPYFYCVWKLFRGQASWRVSLIAFCLALTALLPQAIYSEVDGWHRAYIAGRALWLWLLRVCNRPGAGGTIVQGAKRPVIDSWSFLSRIEQSG